MTGRWGEFEGGQCEGAFEPEGVLSWSQGSCGGAVVVDSPVEGCSLVATAVGAGSHVEAGQEMAADTEGAWPV